MLKYIAIVITVILLSLLFFLQGYFYNWLITNLQFSPLLKILVCICILGLIIALVYVGYIRIKEIKKEKDDDLSKY